MKYRIRNTLVLLSIAVWAAVCAAGSSSARAQRPEQDNNPLSNWRPSGDAAGIRYVGNAKCAECHADKVKAQRNTPMAHALEPIADCEILKRNPQLTFRNGSYSYQITRQGSRSIYTVGDGENKISEPLLYCFGNRMGQTYLFRREGVFYESRVSYYQPLRKLDFTVGQPHQVPTSAVEALGRPLSLDEARECIGCHAPGSISGSQLQLERLVPGVTCESCHGPGEGHLTAAAAGSRNLQIFNPGRMDANALSQEFCGTCHRSFDQVMVMPGQGGINNIRFQPYRIFNSPGHEKSDSRISCVACHDPHRELQHEAAFYDSKCLACHLSNPQEAKTERRRSAACPVGKQQCVTCHMPKVEIPETHSKFTDHWIRIVKPRAPIPR